MKLRFDPELLHQKQAVASVVDLFRGQTPKQSSFTVSACAGQTGLFDSEHGIGNKLELDEGEILANLHEVQLRNGLPQSKTFRAGRYDFDVEMETGTGKTYVYLRSIFELNQAYGFSKFIIVVPSIAIKEGVFKSLQVTKEHFANLYNNTVCDFFVYDSSRPEQVRSFAVSDHVSIMVINIDAFRKSFEDEDSTKKPNIIHRSNDKLNGMKPIELISETKPFVIIDEPQSVDTTPQSKKAIASLHPLCTLRYSATHVEKHNLIYKLDAVDSFDLELVKQIEVASFTSVDYHNNAYMKLISVDNKKSPITAKIELDVNDKGTVRRKPVTARAGSDLYDLSKGRDVYNGYVVDDIYCEKGNEYVSFSTNDDILTVGKAVGDIDDLAVKSQQIRKTIEEHLDKERMLNKQGVKVLSLFFIDRVANYRYYDDKGNPQKGAYAQIFEKHYNELIKRPKYKALAAYIDLEADASEFHNGYFSTDKRVISPFEDDKTEKTGVAAEESAFNLIMRDKERLLSFDTKLRFIFSHSALREGWDNPNVFQICTLNETRSEIKKRQEIGRGLRLCVNQNGERLHGFAINTLTVMANESYEDFAAKLQKEYEKDEGIRFGVIERHTFANILVKTEDGGYAYLGAEKSETIFQFFMEKGYINRKGEVQDSLRKAVKENALVLPKTVASSAPAVATACKKVCGGLKIKSANDKRTISLNKEVFLSDDFRMLWDNIKHRTTYSVDFDSRTLIDRCVGEMKTALLISSAKLVYTKAKFNVTAAGVDTDETAHTTVLAADLRGNLPDVVTYLQNRTSLTRRTVVSILAESATLHLFKKNPQRYMEDVARIIASAMKPMLVDGIKYTRLGNDEYYAQELFETQELTGYLERNMIESARSVYNYVVYDSDIERGFAENFEKNEKVLVYAKLPDWFKISTPLGAYNPDWAVLVEDDGQHKYCFVVETKGSILAENLRPTERQKILCGEKHFEALGCGVVFTKADSYEEFLEVNSL